MLDIVNEAVEQMQYKSIEDQNKELIELAEALEDAVNIIQEQLALVMEYTKVTSLNINKTN